jgi:hypothetical protein
MAAGSRWGAAVAVVVVDGADVTVEGLEPAEAAGLSELQATAVIASRQVIPRVETPALRMAPILPGSAGVVARTFHETDVRRGR